LNVQKVILPLFWEIHLINVNVNVHLVIEVLKEYASVHAILRDYLTFLELLRMKKMKKKNIIKF